MALHYKFIDDKFLLVVSHHQAFSEELSVRKFLQLNISFKVLKERSGDYL
jgi:hypothetical protein